jgi:carbon-monoxide dehydrogenase medium subunit
MIPAPVRYVRPGSVEEALAALAEPDAKVLAGGQSLVSVMKLRLARPDVVVDVSRLGLTGLDTRDGELRIGALTTWSDLAAAPELRRPALAALAECAAGIGDLQVRNRGTLGGSLAHADPASDMPAVLLALGASVVARSEGAQRTIETRDLFLGPFTTALADGELVTEVVIPVPPAGSGSAYASVEHPASGFALAGAAALVRPDGSSSVAVTGIGATPFPLDGDPGAALAAADVFGDRFAPEEYRRHLAAVVVERALATAAERANEDT